ncbi:hypothetical protein D3C87_1453650 [compost metagenome]
MARAVAGSGDALGTRVVALAVAVAARAVGVGIASATGLAKAAGWWRSRKPRRPFSSTATV